SLTTRADGFLFAPTATIAKSAAARSQRNERARCPAADRRRRDQILWPAARLPRRVVLTLRGRGARGRGGIRLGQDDAAAITLDPTRAERRARALSHARRHHPRPRGSQ